MMVAIGLGLIALCVIALIVYTYCRMVERQIEKRGAVSGAAILYSQRTDIPRGHHLST